MTKRAVIITTSILIGLIMVLTILFGVVFRVRNIDVSYSDDFRYKTQVDEIPAVSNLKKNDSIFGVKRNKIANNIESEFHYAKAEVNISGFTSVKIKLTNREPLYYVVQEAVYYIMDEDCKVLEITADTTIDGVSATEYILLDNVFEVDQHTKAGQFLNNKYTSICGGLYNALYSNAMLNLDDGSGTLVDRYLEREDMYEIINSVKFTQVDELNGRMDKLIMTTSYGVKITIIEPQKALDLKINMAFSALRTLIERGAGEETAGTIAVRYSYDQNNIATPKCEYHTN